MIDWILENIEWLFSGIGCVVLSFFFGRKSIQNDISVNNKSQKIIKGNGINNRTAETYHEDNSTHIENKNIIIKNNHRIDYDNYVDLTLCASGCEYISPTVGVFSIKGLDGSVSINDKITEKMSPEGKIVNVDKNDKVKIVYGNLNTTKKVELRFYHYKDVFND